MSTSRLKYPCAILLLTLVWAVLTRCETVQHSSPSEKEKDSVTIWLKKARADTIARPVRKQFLVRAYDEAILQNDSSRQRSLWSIAYEAIRLRDSSMFRKSNKEALQLALKMRDTFGIADIHWNYGAFYLDRKHYDSAYYHYSTAQKLFKSVPHSYYSGKMLYNMAFIRGRIKDYTACEVLLFQAIAEFKPENRYKQLYQCYNHLGVIFDELKEFDKAVSYHKIALEYLDRIEDTSVFLQKSQNNIGLIYQKQGLHEQALTYFNKALNTPNLKSRDISLYARLIDNIAYSKFLNNDTTQLPGEFHRALHIRDSMHNGLGVTISKLHMAEYYAQYKDTALALSLTKEACKLAQSKQNNRDVLSALLLLSRLDKKNGQDYLQKYIELNNDIQERERKTRNKFTRIQYETDQYIEKTRVLSTQKVWILTIGIALVLLLSLLYILNRQYARNKFLHMENRQQRANEQIYLLSLKQQAKLQEGRNQERIRISEELHDSILGNLFAIRMGWGFLKLQGHPDALQKHRHYLEELQRIEKEIRDASHELKDKLVAYPINFINVVEKLIQNRGKTGDFKYKLIHDDAIPWEDIDEQVKVNLYRVIEEALQNCVKHAGAGLVEVRFELSEDNHLRLIIRDNGVGFNLRKRHKGIGIRNMQSRVQKIKGEFCINSEKNRGTTITVSVPV
ncbi:tetratricopeptide repeat-containing sensor histidine kinase [Sinomicrobium weinanense]|uniref:Tetratricopeptide repeat protein n=1 Tax=Sinomicrobium weinanense TaxID=2842200 RepID=A0A926JPV5_9FLAO|nr:tetratricopeptide repeat-containing sensor histidine kinase [Sinomicrobium weinanense]MBC9795134.1 tetratricopeptide repeat protein [Sinomicrobium weinanense]MBU3123734.1 tetratricopeptide repeat protein [Sinomicrobium weinanense]